MKKWEYCMMTCTPMSGLDDAGIRLSYHLVAPEGAQHLEILSDDPSPVVAIGCLLNKLGADGWELVNYDMTTNRGVFKRPNS